MPGSVARDLEERLGVALRLVDALRRDLAACRAQLDQARLALARRPCDPPSRCTFLDSKPPP